MSRDYYAASPPDPEEPRMRPCRECYGTGGVCSKCEVCDGTGEVEDDRECDPGPDTLEEARGER